MKNVNGRIIKGAVAVMPPVTLHSDHRLNGGWARGGPLDGTWVDATQDRHEVPGGFWYGRVVYECGAVEYHWKTEPTTHGWACPRPL